MDYYALDLDRKELERTLAQLPPYKHVRSHGLWGTYDDGRDWLKEPFNIRRQKCVLSLGSSIGAQSPPLVEYYVATLTSGQGTSTVTRPQIS